VQTIAGISYFTWEQDAPVPLWPAAVKRYVLLLTKGGDAGAPWVRAYGVDVAGGRVVEVIDVDRANLGELLAAVPARFVAHLADSGTVGGQPMTVMKGSVPDDPPKGGVAYPPGLDAVVQVATAMSTQQSKLFPSEPESVDEPPRSARTGG
jgi:hypothetical protein